MASRRAGARWSIEHGIAARWGAAGRGGALRQGAGPAMAWQWGAAARWSIEHGIAARWGALEHRAWHRGAVERGGALEHRAWHRGAVGRSNRTGWGSQLDGVMGGGCFALTALGAWMAGRHHPSPPPITHRRHPRHDHAHPSRRPRSRHSGFRKGRSPFAGCRGWPLPRVWGAQPQEDPINRHKTNREPGSRIRTRCRAPLDKSQICHIIQNKNPHGISDAGPTRNHRCKAFARSTSPQPWTLPATTWSRPSSRPC
jgi:hypothetical protein